ncbi:major facilitator superfamily protein [Staphylococcus petrasii]|uniref:MFS transporter n=3 Tax=Staphylococcus petrasii TaxID=1276936 RepID=A0A380G2X9_9STAP|nr:MFS transporter [Staphylococcus petrasii]TGE11753.1 MFS transporter [Staphylococcus petrasii]TGE18543.1 MFS transporter [Staphylococcus petrasii]SUM44588.1 major facilitator superfamily protein [Staphylococcus petrasii]
MKKQANYNVITTILFFSGILVMCSLYTALPLTSVFSKDFEVSKATSALNGVIFSVMYSVSCLFYGTISEKFGRIKTIIFGLIGLTVICLLIGFVHSFALFLFLRALQGVFAASFSPVSITYVTETYTTAKRVTAITFISTSFMLSGIIGQNLSEIIVNYFSWHIVYFVLTIFYLVIALIIYKYVPESPIIDSNIKLLNFFSNFKSFKSNMPVLLCYAISLTLLIIFICMYDVFSRYITSDAVGASEVTAINAKLFGIIGMLLSLVAGRISGKIGVKNLILCSLIIVSISLLLMTLTTNITILIILSVVIVGGIAFAIPSTISKVGLVVSSNHSFFLSVNTFILFLGTAIAPILNLILQKTQNFSIQIILISIISITSSIFAFLLPKK